MLCLMHNGEASVAQSDTDPRVAARQLEGLRRMSDARRVQLAFVLSEQVQKRVWGAVRQQFPIAPLHELRWRYAEQVYGAEIAARVRRWRR